MKQTIQRNRRIGLLFIAGVLAAFSAHAVDSEFDKAETERLLTTMKQSIPDLPILALFKTPVSDLIGVELDGSQVLYVTRDGKHLINGDMYQLAGSAVTNLAEGRRAERRKTVIDGIPREDMVVFSPSGETKGYITVFTDVDCGYCRKLHQEMAQLNALGVEVRYLAYPRQGLNTPTYRRIVSAWCADNKQDALTALKAGQDIPEAQCDNPVAEQFEIGQQVGVTGTPAIVTSSGQLLPGYRPAPDLAAAAGI